MKKICFFGLVCVLFFAVACSSTSNSSPAGVASLNSNTKITSNGKTSDVSSKDEKLYLTNCAMPGDGSGLMPGTFTLPNGTKVPLGSTIQEGSYLYTVGSAKVVDAAYNVDYLASSEQARMVCRENLANYLNGEVSTSSSRSSTTVNGVNNTASSTKSVSNAEAILQGIEDCGYGLGPDGTSYVLCRVKY